MIADARLARPMRPEESFRVGFDFVNEKEEADTLTGQTVTAFDKNGLNVTATLLTLPTLSGTQIKVKIQPNVATQALSPYYVKFKATTQDGDAFVGVLEILVKD